MKSLYHFLLLIFVIFITGCDYYLPLLKLKYCYDGKDTGIDSLCNVDGYFFSTDTTVRKLKASSFFIYRDGIFACGGGYGETQLEFEEFYTTEEYKKYDLLEWGRYIIDGDTIKAQHIFRRSYIANEVFEDWYKIQDRNTLIHIKSLYSSGGFGKNKNKTVSTAPLEFVYFPFRPDSTCWLKNKWWFSCKSKKK